MGTFSNVIQPEKEVVFGKDHPIKGNWKKEIFRNDNPIILELGCGRGEYTIGLSLRCPGNNYIGIDIKGARLWRGAKTANEEKSPNAAFLRTRIEFINSFFGEDEVEEIWITFPDPHPGRRNSNKRLTSPWFLNCYRLFLKDKGLVHLKTDNIELFKYTKTVIENNNLELIFATDHLYSKKLDNESIISQNKSPLEPALNEVKGDSGVNNFIQDDILAIKTHYEKIFLKDGLRINYLSFRIDKEKILEDVPHKATSK